MNRVRLFAWLNGDPHQRVGIAMFQRAIGAAIVFRVLTEWRFASYLWGPNSLSVSRPSPVLLQLAEAMTGQPFATMAGTYALLAVLFVGAACLLFQKFTRLATVAAFVCFSMLGLRLAEVNDGGDNLATLALMYMMFCVPAGSRVRAGSVRAWVHNLAVVAVCVQVCVVYFVAGVMKMYGETWHNGTALYLISQVEWFSLPRTRSMFANPIIATAAAYTTMIFQVWFPLAVLSRFKFAFLGLAMFFHAGIAVSMGLLSFSTVMAGADLALITDDEYARWTLALASFKARLQRARQMRHAPALLYLDGGCRMCQAFGRQVSRVAFAGATQVLSIRETDSFRQFGITPDQAETRMHLVVPEPPRVYAGFDVLIALAWRSRRLWPVVPALYLARFVGLGPVLYAAVADRRYWFGQTAAGCSEQCFPPRAL